MGSERQFTAIIIEYPSFAEVTCTQCAYKVFCDDKRLYPSVTTTAKAMARKHCKETGHIVTIHKETLYRVEPVGPKG